MRAEVAKVRSVATDPKAALEAAAAMRHEDVRNMLAAGVGDTGGDGTFKPDPYLGDLLQQ